MALTETVQCESVKLKTTAVESSAISTAIYVFQLHTTGNICTYRMQTVWEPAAIFFWHFVFQSQMG